MDFSDYTTSQEYLAVVLIVASLQVAALMWHRRAVKAAKKMRRNFLNALRGKAMNRRELEDRQNHEISEAIFESLCALHENGKITRQKLDKTLRQLAGALYIPDFVPLHNSEVITYLNKEEYGILMGIVRSKKHLRWLISRGTKIPFPDESVEVKSQNAEGYLDDNRRATQLAWAGLDEEKWREEVEEKHVVPDEVKTVQSFGVRKPKHKVNSFGGRLATA